MNEIVRDEGGTILNSNGFISDEWQIPLHLLDECHPYNKRIFSENVDNRFYYSDGWVYIFSYTNNIDTYYFEFFKMRPDGSELEEFYYQNFYDNTDYIHVTDVKDGWVFFTIDLGGCYKDYMISDDGGDEILLESGKYIKGERVSD